MVSLRPSSMVDFTDRELLLQETCEEVIIRKSRDEVRRTVRMPDDGDCEGAVSVRHPSGKLINVLDILADSTGRSRRTVEKCLIWQGDVLLSTMIDIPDINKKRTDIFKLHGTYGGLDDIVSRIRIPQYHHEMGGIDRTNFHGANKVLANLNEARAGLGIGQGDIVSVVLMLSLTTANNDNVVGAVRDLMPEVRQFLVFVKERSLMMDAYWQMAQARLSGSAGPGALWQHTVGACWMDEYEGRES